MTCPSSGRFGIELKIVYFLSIVLNARQRSLPVVKLLAITLINWGRKFGLLGFQKFYEKSSPAMNDAIGSAFPVFHMVELKIVHITHVKGLRSIPRWEITEEEFLKTSPSCRVSG